MNMRAFVAIAALLSALLLAAVLYLRPLADVPVETGRMEADAVAAPVPQTDHKAASEQAEGPTDAPAQNASSLASREMEPPSVHVSNGYVADLEASARTDPEAFSALGALRGLCRAWATAQRSPELAERIGQPQWGIVERLCADGASERFDAILSTADRERMVELLPQPWTYSAQTAEEFAARDARLQETMRRTSSPAGALNAAVVYFDYERFAQWAGPLRPASMYDDRSYRSSRIGLDVAWMYACRLGLDCGPYAALTLSECWQTPGCVPGGAARQVVQMRRSPLELRLVDAMVNRLLAERAAGGP